jgi:hypothetical protein
MQRRPVLATEDKVRVLVRVTHSARSTSWLSLHSLRDSRVVSSSAIERRPFAVFGSEYCTSSPDTTTSVCATFLRF